MTAVCRHWIGSDTTGHVARVVELGRIITRLRADITRAEAAA
jgi:hypothetical protein